MVDGHLSYPLPVSIGVPQGSILDPLLFLLFLNDLPTILQSCETTMYADDTEYESASKSEDYKELETTINISGAIVCRDARSYRCLAGRSDIDSPVQISDDRATHLFRLLSCFSYLFMMFCLRKTFQTNVEIVKYDQVNTSMAWY